MKDARFNLKMRSLLIVVLTLVISYVGYKTQEIPVAGQSSFIITMEEDAQLLQEVIAIGYGTVKKNDATGSLTAIKPEEMNKGLTTNAQDMISGKIAGVVVTQNGFLKLARCD